jgi:hypothetical protein
MRETIGALLLGGAFFLGPVHGYGATPKADAAGDTLEVQVWGDHLEYHREGDLVDGSGHVIIRRGGMTLFADQVSLDLAANRLEAEGNVTWSEGDQEVEAGRVKLDMKTGDGLAEGIRYFKHPWVASGKLVEKKGEKQFILRQSAFSTCLRATPHYRLVARKIKIIPGERLIATNVVAYVGVFPVFWIPWFSRNLKDSRPPILIRPGYDQIQGDFTKTTYNYFYSPDEYGSLEYDWRNKLGNSYGITHDYRLLGAAGALGGYFAFDKNASLSNWNAHFDHRQPLFKGITLTAHTDLQSSANPIFNNNYDLGEADTYRRQSYANLQSSQPEHAWTLQVLDTRTNNPLTNTAGAVVDYQEVVNQRLLPSATYQLFSRPLFKNGRLYRDLSASASRTYQPSSNGDPETYQDQVSLNPHLEYGLRLPKRQNLTAGVTLQESLLGLESQGGSAMNQTGYVTNLDLHTRYKYGLTSDVIHSFGRQISHPESLPFAGVTQHHLTLSGTGTWSKASLQATSGLDLLPYQPVSWTDRLDLPRLSGSWNTSKASVLNFDGSFHLPLGQVKTLNLGYHFMDPTGSWQATLGSTWVNNRITQETQIERIAHGEDLSAPAPLEWAAAPRDPDVVLFNAGATFAIGPKWRVTLTQRINLATRRIEEQHLTLWRDLHCWEMDFSVGQRLDGTQETGFSLSLKAFPSIKATLPGSSVGLENFGF